MKSNLIRSLIALCLLAALMLSLVGCVSPTTQGIRSAYINEDGELVIIYTNGNKESLGVVVGRDGADGKDGIDGKDGAEGGILTDGSNVSAASAIALRSTVRVVSTFEAGTADEYHHGGAGVIYRMNKAAGSALIITNAHVLVDTDASTPTVAETVSVYLYGNMTASGAIEAQIVGGSLYYDLAVLCVEDSELLRQSAAAPVTLSTETDVFPGQTAIAVGAPGVGTDIAVSSGIVSVDSEYIELDGISDEMRVMRLDTPVNSGNSGGGLFDGEGRLIGIVNAKIISSLYENIGYAIPLTIVTGVVDNVIDHCYGTSCMSMMRPLVGMTIQASASVGVYNEEDGRVRIVETVGVIDVTPGGLSDGRVQVGDVLVSIRIGDRTRTVTRLFHLIDFMMTARAGDTVVLTVLRDGVSTEIELPITEAQLTPYGLLV